VTTVVFLKKECYVCGFIGQYADMGIRPMGLPYDLDGRGADIHRSTIYMLMQKCNLCHYCSPDISEGKPVVKEIVKTPSYLKQLNDTTAPDSANSFLCWAIIQEKLQLFNEAGQACLFAAWICDDSRNAEKAVETRIKAVSFFQKAGSLNQRFAKTTRTERYLLIDCMRRGRLFKEAHALFEELSLQTDLSVDEESILLYEKKLIEQEDFQGHTIQEALIDLS
jgi:hypothetical protein